MNGGKWGGRKTAARITTQKEKRIRDKEDSKMEKNTQSENVKEWTLEAKRRKSKGFVDMCDTYDFDHYPVFFGGPKDPYKTPEEILSAMNGKNMQRYYGTFRV